MRGWARISAGICVLAAWAAFGAVRLGAQTDAPYLIPGRAVYEKVPLSAAGLDPSQATLRPIRGTLVEALDVSTGAVVASTGTNLDGRFILALSSPGAYRVRVSASLFSQDVVVRDNTQGGAVWSVSAEGVTGEGVVLRATEESRVAGAFNILDTIRQANGFVRSLEAGLEIPSLTLFWSPLNTDDPANLTLRYVGGTRFSNRGFAVILGDRESDSDEFDDDVILHEYAHFLAAVFSRDDSVGGPHAPGDVLDPRVAWSEGWANFFSSLVRGDSLYRDSRSDGVLEYDLESSMSDIGVPGYWNERTVHELLWDLVDDVEDGGDMVAIGTDVVWRAFRALAGDAFVYLPSFLDRLTAQDGVDVASVEQLARIHSLDYLATRSTARTHLFPKFLETRTATGELDSWTQGRSNLARSAHLYAFETTGGAVTLELEITGLGSARNPDANDLDLYLMDRWGTEIRFSTGGGDADPETISAFLPAGRYVVEVRSFSGSQYNSGSYRLTIERP